MLFTLFVFVRLFTYSGVQHILCKFFVFFSSSCVPYVASFSGLLIFDCPFGILKRLFPIITKYDIAVLRDVQLYIGAANDTK